MKSTITGALRPDVLAIGPSRRRRNIAATLCAASILSIGWAAPVLAQETGQTERAYVENGDIIVTARKRQESILKVPVVVTAVSGEQLSNVQVTTVTDLPRLVPGLVIAGNILSIGPQVTIRGVGTSSFDPGVDQSVSLNIDGLSLGQGLAFGSAMFDVGQVEVLKGPQALFYGKSSPGGVISLRTADPTDEFEIIGRASYEFVAREKRGELIVSGPVTETLKARISALYSDADGYFINDAVPVTATGALAPTHRRNPQPRNFVVRGTLLFDPSEDFSVRLKVNHSFDRSENAELKQLANCVEPRQTMTFGSGLPGSPIPAAPNFLTPVDPISFLGTDNCKYDRRAPQVYLDPAAFPGVPNDGVPSLPNVQDFGTLELTYDLQPDLTLTSTTAYYKLKSSSSVNPTLSVASAPLFGVTNRFRRREFTQELRLNSDFSGPLNFTAGAFYEDGQLKDRVRFIRNTRFGFLSPAIVGANILNDDRQSIVDIRTTSLFGQLRYKIVPEFELAGGVRWSDEKRTLSVFDFQNNRDNTPLLAPNSTTQRSKTWSPEFTASWTPTDDLSVFGSCKQG
jgi:iron complex outermembrane receptor protein